MDTNAILDVSIGLALMYLLLSLYCTIANEFIASVFKLRALNLRRGIKQILDDGELLKAFQDTSVMKSMKKVSGGVGPSYVPSRNFVLALFEALEKKGEGESGLAENIQGVLDKLPASDIKDNLIALARESEGKIEKFRDRTEAWFDDMMERGAGVYKRQAQIYSFAIGLVLAIGLNADTIAVAKAIWSDEDLRGQLVETATEIAGQADYVEDIIEDFDSVETLRAQLRPFPIGWEGQSESSGVQRVVGWFLTALAVSLGAPFWFDLLSKFTKLRGAGGVPKRDDEKKKAASAQGGTG